MLQAYPAAFVSASFAHKFTFCILQNRSAAIEEVQLGLHNLSNKAQLLEQLPEFVEFVVQLLEDHNFKIATAGLHILADLAAACGSVLQPHLR